MFLALPGGGGKIKEMPTNLTSWIRIRFCVIIFLTALFMASGHYVEHHQRFQALRATHHQGRRYSPRVYSVTSYGADPSGNTDSTDAILAAFTDAVNGSSFKGKPLMEGIPNLGGPHVNLEGGIYTISRPLRFPKSPFGNILVHGGSIQASDDFPMNSYLIELNKSSSWSSSSSYDFEFITLSDLFLDGNYRANGISVINALRTIIQNCYISRFSTTGIFVFGGHETYISSSFLGQHITAGNDPGERNFTGLAISLNGNDNAVTDVVIFSAGVGILVAGQGNILSGVHCYNKATGFGGVGIHVALPGNSQTRIVNCYMDYTGIVAEDPFHLLVSNSFFLGDAFIKLKSLKGEIRGVSIVDNMFSGSGKGIPIVQLEGSFKDIDQVVVDRNSVEGMSLKSTVARGYAEANRSIWTFDFGPVLLFSDLISHVEYSLVSGQLGLFPSTVIRNISANRVVIESDAASPAKVFVEVDQGMASALASFS